MIKLIKKINFNVPEENYEGCYCFLTDPQTIIYSKIDNLGRSYILSELKNGSVVYNFSTTKNKP